MWGLNTYCISFLIVVSSVCLALFRLSFLSCFLILKKKCREAIKITLLKSSSLIPCVHERTAKSESNTAETHLLQIGGDNPPIQTLAIY